MGIHTSRFKLYLLKTRIDLLEKINTKPYFILYDDNGQSKLHKRFSKVKIILILISQKSFKIGSKHQIFGEICKTYKNSKKPVKRQSDRHGCFL